MGGVGGPVGGVGGPVGGVGGDPSVREAATERISARSVSTLHSLYLGWGLEVGGVRIVPQGVSRGSYGGGLRGGGCWGGEGGRGFVPHGDGPYIRKTGVGDQLVLG